MKSLDDLVMLGDPRLYQTCESVLPSEWYNVGVWADDLHQVMEAVRSRYGFGRAIAAPQIGLMKRIIYMNIDKPVIMVNPEITFVGEEKITLWDDCMSFPNLLVKVNRHRSIQVNYYDEDQKLQQWEVSDDLSELIQHEYDHLDGILCTMRAIDNQSFRWR